jgi:hypothetical protein
MGIFINRIFLLAVAPSLVVYGSHYLEIATFNTDEGVIMRLKIAGLTMKEVVLYATPPIPYEDDTANFLWNPPSVISLVQAAHFSAHQAPIHRGDPQVAAGILRGSILGLWASGVIQFRVGVLQERGVATSRKPAIYLLLVDVGNLNQPIILGDIEKRTIRAIHQWKTMYASAYSTVIARPAPTIPELIDLITPTNRYNLATQVIRDAVNTATRLNLAKSRRNGLDFNTNVRDFLRQDADTLQSISDTTATYYDLVASEIERALASV